MKRLGPTRTTVAAVAGLLWAVSFGAVRDFVWADLREGMISLRGLSATVRGLVLLGFGLLAAMLGSMLLSDVWRAWMPLLPAVNGVVGRGSLLPIGLLPATLFVLSVAWAFFLAGALHSHWAIRVGVLLVYLLSTGLWLLTLIFSVQSSLSSLAGPMLLLALVGLLFVLLLFALSIRWRPSAGLTFVLLFCGIALTHVLAQAQDVQEWRALGMPVMLAKLSVSLVLLQMLAIPLLLMIGVDIAGFTQQASTWVVQIVVQRLPGWGIWVVLLGVLGWRLQGVAMEAVDHFRGGVSLAAVQPYLGAAGVLGWSLLLTVLARWRDSGGDNRLSGPGIEAAVDQYAGYVVVAVAVVQMVAVQMVAVNFGDWDTVFLTGGVALGLALLLILRGRSNLGLYLGLVGALHLWSALTEPDGLLGALHWDAAEMVDFWWVVFCVGVGLAWTVRGVWDRGRAARLLFLLLATALLRQVDFIEDPFSPFLAFAGIGFVAFGVAWDALTIGSWANVSTPALPRTGRIFLYLGYVLLTVTVVNWAVASHDLRTIGFFTGDFAVVGFTRFGLPFLYALFVLTGMGDEEWEA
ncbi:MAG: hypothetical protein D6790_18320 [Caldilineae bacterium]|nr:MAG: hypothetical protein D6790_18320 [Caldilineae bacterium]